MSVRVMTAVWGLDLPDSEKIVLLALADCANDEGLCWPSMATLAAKCSKSDRTVQMAVKSLVAKGHLSRDEVPGKGCFYTVHPRSGFTPEAASPPKGTTKTPEAISGDPRSGFGQTVIEPSITVKRRETRGRAPDPFPRPEWADPQHWRDFLANRQRKKLANTATAHKRLLDDVARIADDDWPPGRLLEHAAAHGWGGIYDPRKETLNGKQPHHHDRPSAWAPRPGMAGFEPASLDD